MMNMSLQQTLPTLTPTDILRVYERKGNRITRDYAMSVEKFCEMGGIDNVDLENLQVNFCVWLAKRCREVNEEVIIAVKREFDDYEGKIFL